MLDTQQAISVYIYEEACCLFMHTDTEHILVNLVGRWCQETPDTGRVWGSELAAQIPMETEAPLLLCFLLHSSRLLHLSQLLCPPCIFPLFPWPATLRISHLAHISALLSSPLSHHPHCSFLLLPSCKLYASVGGGLLSSPKGRALTLLYGPLRHPCPSFLASAAGT